MVGIFHKKNQPPKNTTTYDLQTHKTQQMFSGIYKKQHIFTQLYTVRKPEKTVILIELNSLLSKLYFSVSILLSNKAHSLQTWVFH